MDLVLDIGNFRVKGALFEENSLTELFVLKPEPLDFVTFLNEKPVNKVLLSSVNEPLAKEIKKILQDKNLAFDIVDFSKVQVILDVEEPDRVGHDRIANVYGALFHFPQNDCIVIDLGTAVTFDVIARDGRYLGGAIYPGMDIGAKALSDYTDLLPRVTIEKPPEVIAKTTKTHIQSGLYWGLLGAVERIVFEMRKCSSSPSDVKVLATGGLLQQLPEEDFQKDLSDFVDLIDPALTLIGLHEIIKEKKSNV